MFDPAGWTPRVPTAAILRARDDDTFWAARRVMAFSDEMIRALVKTGQYSEPQAEALLAKVLIQRFRILSASRRLEVGRPRAHAVAGRRCM